MGNTFGRLRRRMSKRPEQDYVPVRPDPADCRDSGSAGRKPIMRAVCDFEANCPGDLSFRKGDILEVLDCKDESWWQVRHFDTGATGYVSTQNIQTTDDEQAASLDCWFDIDRLESERLLRMPGLEHGTYLLRQHNPRQPEQQQQQQQSSRPSFSLSVRCSIVDSNGIPGFVIRHYRVLPLENGSGFFLSPNRTFKSLSELLLHYKTPGEERQFLLTRPCPRVFTPPPNFRDFEINRDQLELHEEIGRGSFGAVFRARFGPVFEVAVKRMAQDSITVSNDFIREARTMHGMHHPKIVQLIGVCTDREPVLIVTELLPLGSLHAYLQNDRQHRNITTQDMMNYLQQVADGMSYFEQRNYIHCDLRTANILVGNHQVVKVADFGLSRLAESGYYRRQTSQFPLRWSAPESISKKLFTIKSDVWSFGVVIFEVFSRGEKPYRSWRNSEVEVRVVKGVKMPNNLTEYGLDTSMADRLYECMLNCWHKTPKQRPTFRRLKELFEDFALEGEGGYVEIGDKR